METRFRHLRRRNDAHCVVLTRKLAEEIDGIDLSRYRVGDVLYLNPRDAALIVAEGWAERLTESDSSGSEALATAADHSTRREMRSGVAWRLRHGTHQRAEGSAEVTKQRLLIE